MNKNESSSENIVEKNSSDFLLPNFDWIPDTTGINAELSDPSAKSLRKRLGNLNETKKASDINPAPRKRAINKSLTKPKILLTRVSELMIETILKNIFLFYDKKFLISFFNFAINNLSFILNPKLFLK